MSSIPTKRFHPDKNGIIAETIYGGGKLEKFTSIIDFKAFYNELHDVLVDNKTVKFTDMWGHSEDKAKGDFFDFQSKKGEHTDNDSMGNRTGDIFEVNFVWSRKDENSVEMEMKWQAKAPTPFTDGNGWVEVTIDLVCRHMVNREVLVGNNKKIMQEGAYEFRNKIEYKNKFIRTYLSKVPFVKNSPTLQGLYLDWVYAHAIENDVHWSEHKIVHLIYGVIHKHFQ